MKTSTMGVCAGGNYFVIENPNAHQSSPSKRHSMKTGRVFLSKTEREKLGLYIADHLEYEQEEYPNRVSNTALYLLIGSAIDAYASINYDE